MNEANQNFDQHEKIGEKWHAREELASIIYAPRYVPVDVRKRIINILGNELFQAHDYEIKDLQKFVEHVGSFYPIWTALKWMKEWNVLKNLIKGRSTLVTHVLTKLSPLIFDLMEMVEENTEASLEKLEKTILSLSQNLSRKPKGEDEQASEKPRTDIFEDLKILLWEQRLLWGRSISENSLESLLSEESFLKDVLAEINKEEKKIDLDIETLARYLEKMTQFTSDVSEKQIQENDGQVPDIKVVEQLLKEDMIKRAKRLSSNEQFLNGLRAAYLRQRLNEIISWIKEHERILSLLEQLYPGRLWDYSRSLLHRKYFQNLAKHARLLENVKELEEIVKLLGKIELEEGQKRLEITRKSFSEIHGIRISGDLERLLPVELLKLLNPKTKLLFYAKWMEQGLLTYELRGKHWTGGPPKMKKRGPVVALVDTSGSMHGAPETLAKALILAIVKKMLPEKRPVKVILFSSTNQTREIELSTTRKMADEFLAFLSYSFGGGTDFNTALKAGLDSIQSDEYNSADLLFISDGLSVINDKKLLNRWQQWREEKDGRVFTVIIGNDRAGGLDEISDYVFMIDHTRNWSPERSPAQIMRFLTLKKPLEDELTV